jgi:paired amphipathic helix protein Sin3a
MEIDENKVRGLAAQNLQRQRMREEELQRQKYLTKPLSEIVSGDTEVSRCA